MLDTLAYKLSVLYKNFYAYASARLHPFGLHNAWIFFILYVGKHADCTPAELTKSLHVDWGYSQRCITKLVEEGFLTKEKAGRSYHLNLTGGFWTCWSFPSRCTRKAISCFSTGTGCGCRH